MHFACPSLYVLFTTNRTLFFKMNAPDIYAHGTKNHPSFVSDGIWPFARSQTRVLRVAPLVLYEYSCDFEPIREDIVFLRQTLTRKTRLHVVYARFGVGGQGIRMLNYSREYSEEGSMYTRGGGGYERSLCNPETGLRARASSLGDIN